MVIICEFNLGLGSPERGRPAAGHRLRAAAGGVQAHGEQAASSEAIPPEVRLLSLLLSLLLVLLSIII